MTDDSVLTAQGVLDLSAPVEAHRSPYTWAVVLDLVPADVRAAVRSELPSLSDDTRAARTMGGDKSYGMFVLPLVAHGSPLPALDDQGEVLQRLVAGLQSAEYRAWAGEVLGVDVSACDLDVGVFHFKHADYITPHTDKPGKVATHVLYFNEAEWLPEHGGDFEVRDSADVTGDPVALVRPNDGRSVLFARSSDSWHAVSAIRAPEGLVRWTMQVEMWAPQS